ncbi:type 4 pilus major pilin [Burkholderia sp. WAC0059]|uniref:type 4 pilus major pilin n=1 Tax=Burkholderia sp. WAC0059 TaxID=2066022 RepID=UPI001CA5B908|nr:type 4 pilus major pilin [Burkholderia sp. WAC0059]
METTQHSKRFAAGGPGAFRRQRGATLLEGIAFLGIAAIILIGALALFTNAFRGAQGNQLTEEVNGLQAAIRKVYEPGAGMETNLEAGTSGLIQAGVVPNTLTVTGTTITNEWGGAVTVTWNAGDNAAEISYTDVPQPQCIAALTGSGDNWSQVGTASGGLTAPPVNATTAASDCGTSSNTLEWEFTN